MLKWFYISSVTACQVKKTQCKLGLLRTVLSLSLQLEYIRVGGEYE